MTLPDATDLDAVEENRTTPNGVGLKADLESGEGVRRRRAASRDTASGVEEETSLSCVLTR
jgi:hypothetical protein